MIIQCEACGTRYRFAEERAKPGGTKVRCARCGSVFWVSASVSQQVSAAGTSLVFSEQEGLPNGVASASERETVRAPGEAFLNSDPTPTQFPGGPASPDTGDVGFFQEKSAPAVCPPSKVSDTLPHGASHGNGLSLPPEEKDFLFEAQVKDEKDEDAPDPEKEFSFSSSLTTLPGTGESIDFNRINRGRRRSTFSSKLLLVILLVIAALGGGMAGYVFWSGESFDAGRLLARIKGFGQKAPKPAGRIHLANSEGFFVINPDAGRLFVIRGLAVNEFPEARSAISVKGALYDTTGKIIAQKTIFCGNPLEEDALKTLPFRKIEEAMKNQFGADFSNLTTAPGKTIPFTIVFRNVPDKLAEFSVEAGNSTPATINR